MQQTRESMRDRWLDMQHRHQPQKTAKTPLAPIARSHALVPYRPSWLNHATPARNVEHTGPVVRWLDGFHEGVQLGVVTLLTALASCGKSSVAGYIAADQTRRGKRVVIYRSAEDSKTKWNRRIELMDGSLDLVSYVDDPRQVWSILESHDAPDLLIIDPLQQFLGAGVNYGPIARAMMNDLTRHADKHQMAIIGVIHWTAYRNKIMGHEEIGRIARVHLKIEKGDGAHRWILKRIKSNDAAPNWFLRFCTYRNNADDTEPAQVRFDSMTWEPSPDSVERDAEEIERYIRDMTGDAPYPVKKLESDVKNHGWIKYRRDVVPWLKRNGWKSTRAGRRGSFWWLPNFGRGYAWNATYDKSGCWMRWDGEGIWTPLPNPHEEASGLCEALRD
jgi:AAA domain